MSLESCVKSLQGSNELLSQSLDTLSAGIRDFPRLSRVLQNTRHFELVPEADIVEAQAHVKDEVVPQIEELLQRARQMLNRLERREYSLRSKKELQQVRLTQSAYASS